MASCFYEADQMDEPSLDEVFAEPIIQLVMQRDGVNMTDMRSELSRMLSIYTTQAA